MNKYFLSAVFAAQAMVFSPTVAANSFEKLTPRIMRDAKAWTDNVLSSINTESQLCYLNLFALNAQDFIEAFIKCAEYIETQQEMLPSYEELGGNIMEVIRTYVEEIQEKIAKQKNITDKEKEALAQKLGTKIQELVAHINTIYYQILFNAVSKKGIVKTVYMFDEKGLIPQRSRTSLLPESL
jgi:hypothetical protein